MKIRLMGTEDECRVAAILLGTMLEVLEQSDPYPNRPPSQLVRIYLEARVPVEAAAGAGEGGGSRG